jgi:polyisoprenoid-binding protein YceI
MRTALTVFRRSFLVRSARIFPCFLFLAIAALAPAMAQDLTLQVDPSQTSVRFTLDAALHSVHGTFQVKSGSLQFSPEPGNLTGSVVVDARSGNTSSGMRDRKMHREVLESEKFPEISFRPDHVEGNVALLGKSSVKVHGIFRIHGVDREITVPTDVEMSADHWTAALHFTIPYAKWGMTNPSTLFLRVSDSVEIEINAAGKLTRSTAAGDSAQ